MKGKLRENLYTIVSIKVIDSRNERTIGEKDGVGGTFY